MSSIPTGVEFIFSPTSPYTISNYNGKVSLRKMPKSARSAIISLRSCIRLAQNVSRLLRQDQILLFSAGSSFFLLLSAVPFFMLLLSISQIFLPVTWDEILLTMQSVIPEDFLPLLRTVAEQLAQGGSIPLLSVTAVTALWSASRGIASLERGIAGVYEIPHRQGFIRDALRSFLYTAGFILLLLATQLLLVFGAQIADGLMHYFPALEIPLTRLMNARGLFIFGILTFFFTLFHRLILHHAHGARIRVLPGAALSAGGWMLFSFIYSLYIRYFPRASYLYGGLALLLVMMLWVYFCMIILLCGAEVNKILGRAGEDKGYVASLFR